jgi:hypothetical protein
VGAIGPDSGGSAGAVSFDNVLTPAELNEFINTATNRQLLLLRRIAEQMIPDGVGRHLP